MAIEVRPATRFADVKTMVGPKRPDANVCWCLSYRLPSKENLALSGTARGERVKKLCREEPPPGVIAYDGDEVVGWAGVHPRADTGFATNRRIPHIDDLDVWSVWCIRVRPGHRGQGISHTLLEGAVAFARENGAPAIEGYPVDNKGEKVDLTMAYVGTRSLFLKAGLPQGRRHHERAERLPAHPHAPRPQLRSGAVYGQTLEHRQARHEVRRAGERRGEVEQAVVGAGREADEHAQQHPVDRLRRSGVTGEVGAELAGSGLAERHVVAEDAVLGAVGIGDGREGLVGGLGAGRSVVELDVVGLGATHDGLLLLGRESTPGGHVVHVPLHGDVAAAAVGLVLIPDDHVADQLGADRVRRAVDETEQVARVEVAEARHLVGDVDAPVEGTQQQPLELEAEIEAIGADVEEQVAGGGHRGVHRTADRGERTQLGRHRLRGQPGPGRCADADDAAEVSVEVAEAHALHEVGDAGDRVPRDVGRCSPLTDGDDEEDRRPGERSEHALRLDGNTVAGCVGHVARLSSLLALP